MSDSMSTYLANQVLDWLKGTTFVAAPANTYVSLWTTDPLDDGSGTEVTGGSYARVQVASGGWSAKTDLNGGRAVSNSANVTFPTATADWGTVTHIGISSASTAGNLYFYGPLEVSVSVLNGETFYIPAGDLVVQIGD